MRNQQAVCYITGFSALVVLVVVVVVVVVVVAATVQTVAQLAGEYERAAGSNLLV